MKRSIWIGLSLLALGFAGCEKEEDEGYSDEDLVRYRSALPNRSALTAPTPPPPAAAFGANDAFYPSFAVPIAMQINQMIGGTLDVIEFVASLEPTVYDSDDLEFWWGPIPDGDSALEGDHYSLYIHDKVNDADYNEADPDSMRYEFAVIRGLGNDVSNLTPIIYGVARPVEGDEDADYGIGAMIYDFDNNVEFEDLHNPGHGALTSGRMASIFAKGPDENVAGADVTFAIAAFRDFLPEDANPGDLPINVDYFWGNIDDSVDRFDFLDLEFDADVLDDSAAVEALSMKLAFYNEGIGRALVGVTGGDAGSNALAADECWDANVQQTYLAVSVDTGAGFFLGQESGSAASCVWTATQFDDVPELADVSDMGALVSAIANTGIPSDLPEEND